MSHKIIGLTRKQRHNVEEFLHLFTEVEAALKKTLRRQANDRTGTSVLINQYVTKNPYWADSANQLRNLADIRNLLTHQRGTVFGYPIAVSPVLLSALRGIRDHLLKPEPVSGRYSKEVITVSGDDTVASVLAVAFERGFSQFPVL